MKRNHIKATFLAIIAIVALVLVSPATALAQRRSDGGTIPSTDPSLIGALNKLTPEDRNLAFITYKWFRSCIDTYVSTDRLSVTEAEFGSNDWFSTSGIAIGDWPNVGVYADGVITKAANTADGPLACNDTDGKAGIAMLTSLLKKMGYPSSQNFLCSIGYDRPVPTLEGCKNYTGEMAPIDGYDKGAIVQLLDKWWTDAGATSLNAGGIGAGSYSHYFFTLTVGCKAIPGLASDKNLNFKIVVFNQVTRLPELVDYHYSDTRIGGGTTVAQYPGTSRPCSEIVEFIDEITDNAVKPMSQYVKDFPSYVPETGDPTTEDEPTTTCGVEGVGWFICPAFNFLAGVADGTYSVIEGLLKTDVRIVDTSQGTYVAWQIMRNVANIGLVIVFLVIVFSQLTGAGVSNYGVKRMLPRIIVGAILVNISFFVAQLAVDVSNILGSSLRDIFELPVFDTFSNGGVAQALAQGNAFTDITNTILATQAATTVVVGLGAAAYFGGIGLLIPVILAAVVAIVMVLLILIARQALVILLIVVSPLAFLAMLLPNTENLFKQWRKIFISMLLLYPSIALLFGGTHLASSILLTSLPADNIIGQIGALAVLILPLFAIIPILRGSLNAVPAIGNLATKLTNSAASNTRKGAVWGTKELGQRAASRGGRFGKFAAGTLFGRSPMGRNRQSAARRAFEEPRIKDFQDTWADKRILNDPGELEKIAIKKDALNTVEGRAAVTRLAQMNSTESLVRIREAHAGDAAAEASYDRATRDFFAPLKAKDLRTVFPPDLLRKKYAEVKGVDFHTMSSEAIAAGLKSDRETGDSTFTETFKEVLQDKDQVKNLTKEVRDEYVGLTGSPANFRVDTNVRAAREQIKENTGEAADSNATSGSDFIIKR